MQAQGPTVITQELCWATPATPSVDSSIIGYYIYTGRSDTPLLVNYLDAAGESVDVSAGGTIRVGACDPDFSALGSATNELFVYRLDQGEDYSLPLDTLDKYERFFFYGSGNDELNDTATISLPTFPDQNSNRYIGKRLFFHLQELTADSTSVVIINAPGDPSGSRLRQYNCYNDAVTSQNDTFTVTTEGIERLIEYTTVPRKATGDYFRECPDQGLLNAQDITTETFYHEADFGADYSLPLDTFTKYQTFVIHAKPLSLNPAVITFPEIGDVDSLKGKNIYIYSDGGELSGNLIVQGTGLSAIVQVDCSAPGRVIAPDTIATESSNPKMIIYRTVANDDYTRACDIGGGGGAGVSDGVATAGALDVPNQEIDITVASPGSNFSIPLALLPTLSGFSGWDQDASDDFDGAFSSLTGVPSGLDDGDNQALSLSSNTLSLTNGGSVDLSTYLDNTDTQDLSLSGTTLSLTDGGSVDLSSIQDGTGTDDQTAAEVSYDNTSSGLATSTVQGAIDLLENEIDAVSSGASDGVATAGALDVPNQEIDITVASPGSNFSIPLALLPTLSGFSGWDQDASDDFDGTWASLTGKPEGLNDGDNQALSLSSNTLSLTNGGSVDLSTYLDNTDTQDLSLSGTTLSLTDGGSVDLSVIQDGTGTDNQTLSLSGANLSISGGNTISLAGLGDGTGTDDQTASEVPYTDTYSFGKTDLQGAVDSLIQEVQSLRDDIVKPLSSSGTITANLTNKRGRIFQVELTVAPSPSTLVVNNPREAGVYTFQFIGVTNNDVAFPANFYNADETSLGTVTFTASDFITCLYDGTDFYCK